MGFVVLPALIPDITAVYDVYFAAFANDAVTRALFPKASIEDLTNPESDFRYVLYIQAKVAHISFNAGQTKQTPVEVRMTDGMQKSAYSTCAVVLAHNLNTVHRKMCRLRHRCYCGHGYVGCLYHAE